jgi:hypothetical protein
MSALLSEWSNSFNVNELSSASAVDYDHLPFSEEDGRNIDELMKLTVQAVLEEVTISIKWLRHGWNMNSLGKKISSVHPLKFFARLLTGDNRERIRSILSVQPKEGAWVDVPFYIKTHVIGGLVAGCEREDRKNNLRQHIDGFVKEVLLQNIMDKYVVHSREQHMVEGEVQRVLHEYRVSDNFADIVRVNADQLTAYASQDKWTDFVSFTLNAFLS